MKFLKMMLFSLICGVFGGAMHILAIQKGITFSLIFGFIEGSILAFALLQIDIFKNFFMGENNES